MAMSNISSVSAYKKETLLPVKDPVSALTHFIGFVGFASAAPFLIGHHLRRGADVLTMTGVVLFVLGLLLLYSASTIYHTFVLPKEKAVILKRFDHLMIFVLIAGSYSPVCLTVLRGRTGYLLLAAVWGIALLGMLFKFFWIGCPKWISSVLYIGLGWACLFAFPAIWRGMSHTGFFWLLAGGLIYTAGGVIYALKMPEFNRRHPFFGTHEIFHLFVMGGSFCHFVVMYGYLG